MLHSERRHSFSRHSKLFNDGKPVGKTKVLLWGGHNDVYLPEGQHLRFKRMGLLPRFQFELIDYTTGERLVWMKRSSRGPFCWDLSLSIGLCTLDADAKDKNLRLVVEQKDQAVAEVSSASGGWAVEPLLEITLVDQVLIGLTYSKIWTAMGTLDGG
ncbi:MAG: hypothetical protein AAF711_11170 [Planctomycetota bacterium]